MELDGFYKGLMIGIFIGVFAGAFLLGLMQMIRRGDDIYEKLILEQRRKNGEGVSGESADYFDHFNAHRDRRICSDRRGEPRKTGHLDHRLLQHVDGHLGVSKGPRG